MPATADGRFPTTDWTLISRLRSRDEAVSRLALDELCTQYRYPLYFYIRRRGVEYHDAEDALQDFLVMLLRREVFEQADADEGRLRGFLCRALKRFVMNWNRDHVADRRVISLDAERELAAAEQRFQKERLVDGQSPERIFERKWAGELLRHVRRKLRNQYAAAGNLDLYLALRPGLAAGGTLRGEDTPAIAAALGMTEGAVRTAMTRLLREYRGLFREEVALTMTNPEQVDDEVQYLISLFRRQ